MSFWEDYDLEQLIAAAKRQGHARYLVVLLGAEAGLRCGEIIALEWSDIRFERDRNGQAIGGQLTVRRAACRGVVQAPKSGKARVVPLTSRLAQALAAQRHMIGPRVLYREDGKELTQQALQRWLGGAQRLAGLPTDKEGNGQIHRLRHTFCSRLAAKGVPATAVKELAGHSSIKTTMRYMHLAPSVVDLAISTLESTGKDYGQLMANRRGEEAK